MKSKDFNLTILVDASPKVVFDAINNVRGWWSEEIEGNTVKLNSEFTYKYGDVHRCKMKIIESVAGEKVVWLVLDNYFNFTKDKSEWNGTKVIFEISKEGEKTKLHFTHEGLVPAYECYQACVSGWTQYVHESLPALIKEGRGKPNSKEKSYTFHEVAARFNELAGQEKWFEIQDEFFTDDIKSIEPAHSPWMKNAEGKANVRKKAEDWVKRITAVHGTYTSEPVVGGNFFAVGREADITVQQLGRIQMKQLMVYEVKDGKIVSEQFFY
jgi:hypothetical protein